MSNKIDINTINPVLLECWKEKFILEAKKVHNNRYDYSKVKFITPSHRNLKIPIIIVCKIHGDFLQNPRKHLKLKQISCPNCNLLENPLKPKRIPKPKRIIPEPDKTINGKKVWIRYCRGCNKELIYSSYNGKRDADNKNCMGNCCMLKKYFLPVGPWSKKCVDCGVDVIYRSKTGFVGKKKCRCYKCHKIWISINNSKASFDMQAQIKKTGLKFRPYFFTDGRMEMVQGYESYTLSYLLSNSIPSNEIKVKGCDKPKIAYNFEGKSKLYLPDAYIVNTNTIVETKSTWTWKKDVDKNISKINAVLNEGYNMRLIVWGNVKKGKPQLVLDKMFFSSIKT